MTKRTITSRPAFQVEAMISMTASVMTTRMALSLPPVSHQKLESSEPELPLLASKPRLMPCRLWQGSEIGPTPALMTRIGNDTKLLAM